ncbi:HNH endonuclease [Thalassobellus suaedae]|uniref:HNH endonuclease n=1 Tax=Thalassobellus suaedae TaxID=3074124 RepID=A0ABY9Y366_9FLAO|nr:HNH endonuclease [Flavobacteriaceae bacterium HL-DH10]
MSINTKEQIHKAFEIAKKVYLNELSLTDGTKILVDIGLKQSSSRDYIYAYSKLMEGELYTRTINVYATDYYLENIYNENGNLILKTALKAVDKHIVYYEGTSGASVIKGRAVYDKWKRITENDFSETVFPNEVEKEVEYSEGKTRHVIVNSYERNRQARQECIEHFGLNCQVCNFNFQEKFGELGMNFIHVHHIVDISTIGKEYSVNPKTDLIPVCPNCHAMLHKQKPAYSVSELKRIMENE